MFVSLKGRNTYACVYIHIPTHTNTRPRQNKKARSLTSLVSAWLWCVLNLLNMMRHIPVQCIYTYILFWFSSSLNNGCFHFNSYKALACSFYVSLNKSPWSMNNKFVQQILAIQTWITHSNNMIGNLLFFFNQGMVFCISVTLRISFKVFPKHIHTYINLVWILTKK